MHYGGSLDLSEYGEVDRQSLAMLFVHFVVFPGSFGDSASTFPQLLIVIHVCLRVSNFRTGIDDAKLGETRHVCWL